MPLSPRLSAVVDALPLRPGLRVLEVDRGPGASGRHLLGVDRSAAVVAAAVAASRPQIAAGVLGFRCIAAEDLVLEPDEAAFDLAFAVPVGALDGRHPDAGRLAVARIRAALVPGGRLFVDGGDPRS